MEHASSPDPDPSRLTQGLKRVLSKRERASLTIPSAKRAGVLIILYNKDSKPHVLLTERSQLVANHRGEVAFPGGTVNPSDESSLKTALRETWEEVGVRVAEEQVLGALDDVYTARSNFVVSPYVAYLPAIDSFELSKREVVRAIEIPLENLLDPSCRREASRVIDGVSRRIQLYSCGEDEIWGVTAKILDHFLQVVRDIYL